MENNLSSVIDKNFSNQGGCYVYDDGNTTND